MPVTFPSENWIEEFCKKTNENEHYRELADDWGVDFDGDFVFVVEPDDGLSEPHYFFVGLEGGRCTGAYAIDSPDDEPHGFTFRGPYSHWKDLVQAEVGAIDGIMTGKFGLDGEMSTVLEYNEAAQELVESVSEIDTEFR